MTPSVLKVHSLTQCLQRKERFTPTAGSSLYFTLASRRNFPHLVLASCHALPTHSDHNVATSDHPDTVGGGIHPNLPIYLVSRSLAELSPARVDVGLNT